MKTGRTHYYNKLQLAQLAARVINGELTLDKAKKIVKLQYAEFIEEHYKVQKQIKKRNNLIAQLIGKQQYAARVTVEIQANLRAVWNYLIVVQTDMEYNTIRGARIFRAIFDDSSPELEQLSERQLKIIKRRSILRKIKREGFTQENLEIQGKILNVYRDYTIQNWNAIDPFINTRRAAEFEFFFEDRDKRPRTLDDLNAIRNNQVKRYDELIQTNKIITNLQTDIEALTLCSILGLL